MKSQVKVCSKCKREKIVNEFHKDKTSSDGCCSSCKECKKKYDAKQKKIYYKNNKEIILEKNKIKEKERLSQIKEKAEKWLRENKTKVCTNCKIEKSTEEFSKQKTSRNGLYSHCKECRSAERRRFCQENKEKVRESKNISVKKRLKNDPIYKLRNNVSKTINKALKRNKGSKEGESVLKYLPYKIEQLKEHLESQFKSWMTWKNHGVFSLKQKTWQIDHIIPQSKLSFDSMKHPNFLKCWSLENLQPLETIKNIKKSDK